MKKERAGTVVHNFNKYFVENLFDALEKSLYSTPQDGDEESIQPSFVDAVTGERTWCF
jgi:hypothetical protein